MKFTNTEVEDFVESLLTIIDHYRGDYIDADSTIDDIEEACTNFRNKYCCDCEKYTWDWYYEHGE